MRHPRRRVTSGGSRRAVLAAAVTGAAAVVVVSVVIATGMLSDSSSSVVPATEVPTSSTATAARRPARRRSLLHRPARRPRRRRARRRILRSSTPCPGGGCSNRSRMLRGWPVSVEFPGSSSTTIRSCVAAMAATCSVRTAQSMHMGTSPLPRLRPRWRTAATRCRCRGSLLRPACADRRWRRDRPFEPGTRCRRWRHRRSGRGRRWPMVSLGWTSSGTRITRSNHSLESLARSSPQLYHLIDVGVRSREHERVTLAHNG